MKKMVITVVFLLMCGAVFAQYAAPENLGISIVVDSYANQACQVFFYWDTIDDPNFDYYECFQDGEQYYDPYGTNFEYGNGVINLPEDNEFHTTGVRAVYTDGVVSDITSVTYYYSATAYSKPTNIVVENDLNTLSANVQFDEPQSGGVGAPTPQEYIYYINEEYAASSTVPEITLMLVGAVELGESYILGIEVLYSDGNSSNIFRPMVHKESYMGELNPADDVTVDETSGILTWNVPGNGDVVGGTISNLVGCVMSWEGYVWPNTDMFEFGDGTNHVSTTWSLSGWVHNWGDTDVESMCLGRSYYEVQDTHISPIDVIAINQIADASTLDFELSSSALYDADTSPDCYGDFLVYKNIETGYYGVVQVIDVTDCIFGTSETFEYFDMTWWFQTTGTGDFSSAERYYPLYYNIYLDGIFVDSVNCEIVTVDKNTEELIVVDSTLSPDGEFEYQFEGLVNGETYTAGVEAVYYACVGKAERQEVEFTYNGISVDEPQTGMINPVLSNYPNPFNRHTNISFSITNPGHVTLDVYNIKGEKVKTLVDESLEATDYVVTWNGTDNNGKSVSNGVYLYRMSVDNESAISNKMILMR